MTYEGRTNNLYWNLLQVSMRAKKSLTELCEPEGLNLMQMYTLCTLDTEKGLPMSSISAILACDASTVTGITDYLHGKGLIQRSECSYDRRIKVLTLTEKGTALKEKMLKGIQSFESASLEPLDDTQKDQLQHLAYLILEHSQSKAKD
jgi:MarR family transcriptional regulator, organic hydroperoxide resistance regulator